MGIEIKLTGENWTEIDTLLGNRAPASDETPADFQTVVASFGIRCESEGYDFEIWKKGERPEPEKKTSQAEAKKEEARAKLKDDLKASLNEAPVSETPKKAKKNGAEDPEAVKTQTIARLHHLFNDHKAAVMKILADHGGGAKNFNAVPPENFVAIRTALEQLEATL